MSIRTIAAACVALALLVPTANAATPVNQPDAVHAKSKLVQPGVKTAMHQNKKHAKAIACKSGMKRNVQGKCVSMIGKKK